MRYKRFRIQNFKGVRDTTVDLDARAANVFALVGLNESGKTTILEAIHSFSPDKATSELVGGDDDSGVPYVDRVPRHLISSFTGYVSVTATLTISDADRTEICRYLLTKNIKINAEAIPTTVDLERQQEFQGGDYKKNFFTLRTAIEAKFDKERKLREARTESERIEMRSAFYRLTPDISYFPTFVFDFPRITFLTDRGSKIDQFYRRVFQDILDYDKRGNTIEGDIVRRIRDKENQLPWVNFLAKWSGQDDKTKIQHVLDRAASVVTRVVFGRWNQIFGEDVKGKEVNINLETFEGEVTENGIAKKTIQHDIGINFEIKDGTRRFAVNDRSLGFRWFFSFMLFTQFRVARADSRPLLFLFDEPAANLHAAAQEKLIESFPEIAKGNHMLAYTTHSHYMIEPKWLEQTFIVTNRSDMPTASVIDAVSFDDESLDIKAVKYQRFANDNPTKTSYFQPILDRLRVGPSRFDFDKVGAVVEGKSDYYIIRYASALHGGAKIYLLPGLGAGTFDALIALQIGWGLKLLFLLDGDTKGKEERDRYVSEMGLRSDRTCTIDDLVPNLKEIEGLIDVEAAGIISTDLGVSGKPTKNQIRRFFQENLASNNVKDLGDHFRSTSRLLLENLQGRIVGLDGE